MSFLAKIINGMVAIGKFVAGAQPLLGGQAKVAAVAAQVVTIDDTLVSVMQHVLYINAALKDTTHTAEEKVAMIAPLVAKDLQLMPAFHGHKLQDAGKLVQAATLITQGAQLAMEAYGDAGVDVKDLD